MRVVVALDIGGSHTSAALVDVSARAILPDTLVRREIAHDAAAEVLLEHWASTALETIQRASEASLPETTLHGVGIAMPGPFDYEMGISRLEHKFAALYGQNIQDGLMRLWRGSALTGQRPHFANDAALFTLGEAWAGAAAGQARVLGITLGTGLGSGFVANGRIVTEGFGVPPGGELWNIPYAHGIAEDFVSGRALERRGWAAAQLAALARTGNLEAQHAFTELGHRLGAILEPWIVAFQPDRVVIGGNVARAWDLFAEALTGGLLRDTHCIPTRLFELATLLGAAALVDY